MPPVGPDAAITGVQHRSRGRSQRVANGRREVSKQDREIDERTTMMVKVKAGEVMAEP